MRPRRGALRSALAERSAVPNMFPDFNPPPRLDAGFMASGGKDVAEGPAARQSGIGDGGDAEGEEGSTYTYRWKRSVLAGVEATPPRKRPEGSPAPAPRPPPSEPAASALASEVARLLTFALYAVAIALTLSRGLLLPDMQRPDATVDSEYARMMADAQGAQARAQ